MVWYHTTIPAVVTVISLTVRETTGDTDDEWEIYLFSLFFAQIFLNGSFLLILPYKIFLDDM